MLPPWYSGNQADSGGASWRETPDSESVKESERCVAAGSGELNLTVMWRKNNSHFSLCATLNLAHKHHGRIPLTANMKFLVTCFFASVLYPQMFNSSPVKQSASKKAAYIFLFFYLNSFWSLSRYNGYAKCCKHSSSEVMTSHTFDWNCQSESWGKLCSGFMYFKTSNPYCCPSFDIVFSPRIKVLWHQIGSLRVSGDFLSLPDL